MNFDTSFLDSISGPDIIRAVYEAGVVGAGGAGFPTHIKLNASCDEVIVNGAECEPLLYKDKEIMRLHAGEVVQGLLLCMKAVGASRGFIGLKPAKNREAIRNFKDIIAGLHIPRLEISIFELGNYYPSGDELVLIYDVTRKVVRAGELPLEKRVLVSNVETFYNVARASIHQQNVTSKFLTVCGDVARRATVRVPVGITVRECLELTGNAAAGSELGEYAFLMGGAMMGRVVNDPETLVDKTTAGFIVLEKGHGLVRRKTMSRHDVDRIGKSACDQCSYCTEFCPRYLLGHKIEPHKVMRTLGLGTSGQAVQSLYSVACIECGLCGLYACPEDLLPNEVAGRSKCELRGRGIIVKKEDCKPQAHPMQPYRRVPISRLVSKLGLERFDTHADFLDVGYSPRSVRIPLKQHAGMPAIAAVSAGSRVRLGERIALAPEGRTCAHIHSSIDGTVTAVSDSGITIAADT